MGHEFITSTVAILTALVGLAIVSVLVSKNAQTSQVISAAGNAFSSILSATVAPVTGSSGLFTGNNINLNVPSLLNMNGIASSFN